MSIEIDGSSINPSFHKLLNLKASPLKLDKAAPGEIFDDADVISTVTFMASFQCCEGPSRNLPRRSSGNQGNQGRIQGPSTRG